jgi:hypothetical protein
MHLRWHFLFMICSLIIFSDISIDSLTSVAGRPNLEPNSE